MWFFGYKKGSRVVVVIRIRCMSDLGKLSIAAARGALPEAAIGVLEGIDFGIGIVANAGHALGQTLLVGIIS